MHGKFVCRMHEDAGKDFKSGDHSGNMIKFDCGLIMPCFFNVSTRVAMKGGGGGGGGSAAKQILPSC